MSIKLIRIQELGTQEDKIIFHQLKAQERTRALLEEVYRSKISNGSGNNPLRIQINGQSFIIYPITALRFAENFAKLGDAILVFHRCPKCGSGIYDEPTQLSQIEEPEKELCMKCAIYKEESHA